MVLPPTLRLPIAIARGAAGTWVLFAAVDRLLPPDRDRGWARAVVDWLPDATMAGCLVTGIGAAVVPLLGVALLLAMAQRCTEARPRPWSVAVFLGCLLAAPFLRLRIGPEPMLNGMIATGVAALLGSVEVLVRGLRRHGLTAACMFGVWFAGVATVLLLVWGFRQLAEATAG